MWINAGYNNHILHPFFLFRLENLVYFEPEAVEFIARKVSAASGDARRALDISRRAAELAEKGSHNMYSCHPV